MNNRKIETQFFLSVLFSLFSVVINYSISFFLTSYITETMGAEAYGFVSLAKTFAGYASILTIAINSFCARYISIEYHKGDFESANKYFTSAFVADCFLGAVVLLIASGIIVFLQYFLSIPQHLLIEVKWLFFLDVINFVISSATTVFTTATIIKNRLELGSIAKCFSYVVEAAFLMYAFCMFSVRIYYVGIGLILSSMVIGVANVAITRKYTPELRMKKRFFSFAHIKEIFFAGIWDSVNNIGNLLNSGLDLWVCNVMLSALRSGQLAVVKTVSTIFSTMFQLLSQPLQPLQLKAFVEDEKEKQVRLFRLGIKLNGVISNVAFGFLAVFGMEYYTLWTPSQDIGVIHMISIITIIGTVIEGAVYPLYYIYTLTVKNKIPCYVTVVSGFLNVVGMYFLIRYTEMDVYAVVITTTILSWLVNFVFNPMYSAHCLGVSKWTFYPSLLRHILSSGVITMAFYLLRILYRPSTWTGLFLVGGICLVLGAIIHLMIVLDRVDREMIFKKIFRAKTRKGV
ncbi:MAG: oligosaccharide flippase family protein [Clostridia bacterium]|nr:oligosaccharide flippase family protein [Clostridia bacterium]